MAQPNTNQVHLDAILTNISVAEIQDPAAFVASKVFPFVPVDKQSNKYYVYPKGDWARDEAELRADSAESVGSGYTLSKSPYSCDVFALHRDISWNTIANADQPINLATEATRLLTQRMLIRLERQWASDYFTTGVWDTDVTLANKWDDYIASDPIGDIETAKRTILVNTGQIANTLVIGYDVFIKLKNHPDIVDRYKYTTNQTITEEMLAKLFDIERLLVAKAVYNSANPGATDSFGFVHGKSALLVYAAKNPGIMAPSAGYIFVWTGVSGGLGANVGISRFPIQQRKCDRIEAEMAFDNKVVSTELGYFFNGAVS